MSNIVLTFPLVLCFMLICCVLSIYVVHVVDGIKETINSLSLKQLHWLSLISARVMQRYYNT